MLLNFQELTEPTVIEQGAYMLIACGAFIFVLSFLGYCGAIKESRVLLTAYGLFIIIIVLLQVAAIVLAAIYSKEAETHTKEFFKHTIRKYYTTKNRKDAVTLSWDFMMAEVRFLLAQRFPCISRFMLREAASQQCNAIFERLPRFFSSTAAASRAARTSRWPPSSSSTRTRPAEARWCRRPAASWRARRRSSSQPTRTASTRPPPPTPT